MGDQQDRTALHHCVSSTDSSQCVSLLTRHEPRLLQRQDAEGQTPLQLAVKEGNVPMTTALLRSGADITVKDDDDHTVVHWATGKGEEIFRAVVCVFFLILFQVFP